MAKGKGKGKDTSPVSRALPLFTTTTASSSSAAAGIPQNNSSLQSVDTPNSEYDSTTRLNVDDDDDVLYNRNSDRLNRIGNDGPLDTSIEVTAPETVVIRKNRFPSPERQRKPSKIEYEDDRPTSRPTSRLQRQLTETAMPSLRSSEDVLGSFFTNLRWRGLFGGNKKNAQREEDDTLETVCGSSKQDTYKMKDVSRATAGNRQPRRGRNLEVPSFRRPFSDSEDALSGHNLPGSSSDNRIIIHIPQKEDEFECVLDKYTLQMIIRKLSLTEEERDAFMALEDTTIEQFRKRLIYVRIPYKLFARNDFEEVLLHKSRDFTVATDRFIVDILFSDEYASEWSPRSDSPFRNQQLRVSTTWSSGRKSNAEDSARKMFAPNKELVLTVEEQEKPASWLELFYDIFYVAILAQLTYTFEVHNNLASTVLDYIATFVPVWWAWSSVTLYATRYDTDDLWHRLMTLIQMLALSNWAINISDALGIRMREFAISFMVIKGVLMIKTLVGVLDFIFLTRTGFWKLTLGIFMLVAFFANTTTKLRRWVVVYAIGHGLSVLCWGLSLLTFQATEPGPLAARYILWFFPLVVEVSLSIMMRRRIPIPLIGAHLPERFGLFTIVVLGENVVGILGTAANLYKDKDYQVESLFLLTCMAIAIMFALWWLYFDDFAFVVHGRLRGLRQTWIWIHLPFHCFLSLFGVTIMETIKGTVTWNTPSSSSLSSLSAGVVDSFNNIPVFAEARGRKDAVVVDKDVVLTGLWMTCGLVYFFNGAVKYVTLQVADKFDRTIYTSRFALAIFVFCLTAVPSSLWNVFSVTGSLLAFTVFQVLVDLYIHFVKPRYTDRPPIEVQFPLTMSENPDGMWN